MAYTGLVVTFNAQSIGAGGQLTPTNLSITGTSGKSLVIKGLDLWCDTAATSTKLRIGYSEDNGSSATYLLHGFLGEAAGLKFPWTLTCPEPIALASGKGLVIHSTAAISFTGTIWMVKI